APDQELHRHVVDTLGIGALVGAVGPQPALREDIARRAGDGLIALAGARGRLVDDIVEHEVPLVEPVCRPGEVHRTAFVLRNELVQLGLARGDDGIIRHRNLLYSWSTGRFQSAIAGTPR